MAAEKTHQTTELRAIGSPRYQVARAYRRLPYLNAVDIDCAILDATDATQLLSPNNVTNLVTLTGRYVSFVRPVVMLHYLQYYE